MRVWITVIPPSADAAVARGWQTFLVIEAVLQALMHHPRPRLLLCAPSNQAADVLARRLLEKRQALESRMAALRDGTAPASGPVTRTRPWFMDAPAGGGAPRVRLLRLNAQQRMASEVNNAVLPICSQVS